MSSPPGVTRHETDEMMVTSYAVVIVDRSLYSSVDFEDASATCGMNGLVYTTRRRRPHSTGIAPGDLLWRVEGVDVLGMAYADAIDVVRGAARSTVLEFVPKCRVAEARRLVAQRQDRTTLPREPTGDSVRFVIENQHAVLKRGYVDVHDQSLSDQRSPWRRLLVTLRVSGIECKAHARTMVLHSELGFSGSRRCEVSASAAQPTAKARRSPHVLKLRVDDDKWALAFASSADHAAWLEVLMLVCEAAKVLSRDPEEQPTGSQVDVHRLALLMQQREQEQHVSLRSLSCGEMKTRMRPIDERMAAIRSQETAVADPLIRRSLHDEYARLEHDKRFFTARIDEEDEARRDREWEEANAAVNCQALRAVRRCMPVDINDIYDSKLPTPSGEPMPQDLVQKFVHTASVLLLLRSAPAETDNMFLRNMDQFTEWELTVTERRALHAYLRELGESWRVAAMQDDDAGRRARRKWEWFAKRRRMFQHVLDVYERHVARFGPAGDHKYARHDQDDDGGCPLRGTLCPLAPDCLYDVGIGFPDGDEYSERPVRIPTVRFSSLDHGSKQDKREPNDMFCAASALETYGISSIWTDPLFLQLQRGAESLNISQRVFPPCEDDDCRSSHSEVYKGTFDATPVAVKRLVGTGNTVANAAMLAMLCKSLGPRLTHPHVVPLVGLVWTKALDLQVVTPWIPGGDLRALLDTPDAESLTWEDFKCQVAIGIAEALEYLDSRGQPAGLGAVTSRNVLLSTSDDGSVAAQLNLLQLPILDIGAARDRVPSPIRYVAPEIILGGASTAKSDVYALGVLMTELDSTKEPFHDATNPNGSPMDEILIAMRVARRNMRPTLSRECPTAIAELVERSLRQDPEERPSSSSLTYSLREFLKNEL